MSHYKQQIKNYKGEVIGEEIIHIPYHKPYNRDNQKSLDEQLIEEGLDEYKQEQQDKQNTESARYLQTQVRLIREFAEYVGQDLRTIQGRNAMAELWIDCGYAERFRELYKPNGYVTLKQVLYNMDYN